MEFLKTFPAYFLLKLLRFRYNNIKSIEIIPDNIL